MTLSLGGKTMRTLEVVMYFDEECLEPLGARVGTLVLNEDQAPSIVTDIDRPGWNCRAAVRESLTARK